MSATISVEDPKSILITRSIGAFPGKLRVLLFKIRCYQSKYLYRVVLSVDRRAGIQPKPTETYQNRRNMCQLESRGVLYLQIESNKDFNGERIEN